MQAAEQRAFVAEVFAAFGQQAQNCALVFGRDWAQTLLPECSDGDGERICRVALTAAAGGKNPDLHGQCRGDIDHGFPTGHQDLGDSAAQTVGALDSESAFGPLRGPAQQLLGRACVDHETPHRELTTRGIDG